MTLIDRGTLPAVAPLGSDYWMNEPIHVEQGVWALPQHRNGAPFQEPPIVQTYHWGQWGAPLGTATYSRTGVPGGRPTLTPGYLHRNGVIGLGLPPLKVEPWTPQELAT